MTVFLIAQEYSINQIVTKIGFITNYSVERVLILRELVSNVGVEFQSDVICDFIDNIDDAISECSNIWIFDGCFFSKDGINYIKEMARSQNKQVITSNDLWTIISETPLECRNNDFCIDSNIPTIMICNMGNYSQLYSVEANISEILFRKGISAHYAFSKVMCHFLMFLQKNGMPVHPTLCQVCMSPDINVITCDTVRLDYSDLFMDFWKVYNIVKPDTILIVADRENLDQNTAAFEMKYISYRIGKNPDCFLVSNYRSINLSESLCKYMKVSPTNRYHCGGGLVISERTIKIAIDKMLQKITLPEGVEQINIQKEVNNDEIRKKY